jgi:hypothetical protein
LATSTGWTAGSRSAARAGTSISRPGSSASRPCARKRTTRRSPRHRRPDLSPPLLAGAAGRRRRPAAADPQPLSHLDQSLRRPGHRRHCRWPRPGQHLGAFDWRSSFLLAGGIEATVLGDLTADAYNISEDLDLRRQHHPHPRQCGVELRWPLVKAGAGGAVQVIEPVAQADLGLVRRRRVAERGFGAGRVRRGQPFFAGPLSGIGRGRTRPARQPWGDMDPARPCRLVDGGDSRAASFARKILASSARVQGLDGRTSDWLAAVNFDLADGLELTARAVLDDDLVPDQGRGADGLQRPERTALAGSVIWAVADPMENRPLSPRRKLPLTPAASLTRTGRPRPRGDMTSWPTGARWPALGSSS